MAVLQPNTYKRETPIPFRSLPFFFFSSRWCLSQATKITHRRLPRKFFEVAGVAPRSGAVEVKLAVHVPVARTNKTNTQTTDKTRENRKHVRVVCECPRDKIGTHERTFTNQPSHNLNPPPF